MKNLRYLPLILLLCGFVNTKPQKEVQDAENFTLLNNGYHIHLFGMIAPKMAQGQCPDQLCQDKQGKDYPCAEMAKNYLQSLIEKKPIRCFIKSRSHTDTVSECFLHGRSVNITMEMLRAGWAVVDPQHPYQRFITAQDEAKSHHAGIWQGKFVQPAQYLKTCHP